MKMFKSLAASLFALTLLAPGLAQADVKPPIVGTGDYVVKVDTPSYAAGQGPRIAIDEAHFNYQTMEDRFKGFADLMAADGARVSALHERISEAELQNVDVLVICNALNQKNYEEKQTINKWRLPAPSAFADDEIKTLAEWVKNGGSLMLVADHMPFPAAAEKLAAAFGIVLQDNFAFDAAFTYKPGDMNLMTFYGAPPKPSTGILNPDNPVAKGIPYVVTFTGHAFRMAPGVEYSPLMTLGMGANLAWPSDHADISLTTPFSQGVGFLQGATLSYGKGRVAVFGEASMFSVNYAEWANYYPTGFHNPDAPYNKQFALNVAHWLAGKQ